MGGPARGAGRDGANWQNSFGAWLFGANQRLVSQPLRSKVWLHFLDEQKEKDFIDLVKVTGDQEEWLRLLLGSRLCLDFCLPITCLSFFHEGRLRGRGASGQG